MNNDEGLIETPNPELQKASDDPKKSQRLKNHSVLYAALGIVLGPYIAVLLSLLFMKLTYVPQSNDPFGFSGFSHFLVLTCVLILIFSVLFSIVLVFLHKYFIDLFDRLTLQRQTDGILYKLLKYSNWIACIIFMILFMIPALYVLWYGWY
jgi:small-conductance mechanosensitive channel